MKKLRIGIIDLVSRVPTRGWYARFMNANLSSIMPQVVGVWARQEGHEVAYVCFTGPEDLLREMPADLDLVFIGAFTEAAHTAYALSNYLRSRGAVTALGGPHAQCYPEDAQAHFDYVLGLTGREQVEAVLRDCSQHRPVGVHVTAGQHPAALPGMRERWQFMESVVHKAALLKIVPILGSFGCPYTCSFCIDAAVPYQPLDFGVLREDLKFLQTRFKKPRVSWYDPNFGVRFDDYLNLIEEAVPPGRIEFIAESSLSLLSEPRLQRLKRNGFKAMAPGIESWFDMGNKSKTGSRRGIDKVRQISDHINMLLRYIPYVQTNFVVGLDSDEGPEPFELTKRFLDMTPGAFPGYSLLTSFGRAAVTNLAYQRAGRVLPFPFHFLNNNLAMNVKPRNYSWRAFYDHLIDLVRYSFSPRMIMRRFAGAPGAMPRLMNLARTISREGAGRIRYYREIRSRLDADPEFEPYFEQKTAELPNFFLDRMRRDLDALWEWLPKGGIHHDAYAYLKSEDERLVTIA